MKVLVIDVGGTHVKMLVTGVSEARRFASGRQLTATALVERVTEAVRGWSFDVISLGYPGVVGRDGPAEEPGNLAGGWVGFDFDGAFGKPVRLVNDAVMQALGGYDGGRMLFLGLGTGLGSALVSEHVVVPLELGNLPYGPGESLADRLGRAGRKTYGHEQWLATLTRAVDALLKAFAVDYVVLGGGNAKHVDPLPAAARRGGNEDAFSGGFRLWEEMVEPHDRQPPRAWRVVR